MLIKSKTRTYPSRMPMWVAETLIHNGFVVNEATQQIASLDTDGTVTVDNYSKQCPYRRDVKTTWNWSRNHVEGTIPLVWVRGDSPQWFKDWLSEGA